jgi:hypothetical protein
MNDRERDDAQTGRFLSRREVVAYLGAAAGAGTLPAPIGAIRTS